MAEIALHSVLAMVVKCFLDKANDKAAESLKDGDITELRFREMIIRELNDIKSMLRGIVRQDLLAAINYFNDGIEIIYYHLNHSQTEEEHKQEVLEEEREFQQAMKLIKRVSFKTRKSEQLMKVVEQHVIKCHNDITDNCKTLENARRNFYQASLSATRAISNEGMKDDDRILAYKIKIAATLLENFEQPGIAVPICKKALADLSSMPLVKNACQVQFSKGLGSSFKKRFNYEEREALIRSIASVHRTVWHYVHACAVNHNGVTSSDFQQWPLVQVDGRTLHPVQDQEFASYNSWSIGGSGLGNKHLNKPTDIAINSLKHLIVSDTNNSRLSVWSNYGTFMYHLELTQFDDEDLQIIRPRGVAVDRHDRVYVSDSVSSCVHVFDERKDAKWSTDVFSIPEGHQGIVSTFSGIHVDKDERVLVSDIGMKCVHVFSTEGEYLCNFGGAELDAPVDTSEIYSSHITSTVDGIILVTDARHGCIRAYDQFNGFVKNITFDKETFRPIGIAYDLFTREIFVSDDYTKGIFVFGESGEFIRDVRYDVVSSVAGLEVTCEGHVVLVDDKRSLVHVF